MSKRLRSHPNKARSLRPRSLQKARGSIERPEQVEPSEPVESEARSTLPDALVAGAGDEAAGESVVMSSRDAEAQASGEREVRFSGDAEREGADAAPAQVTPRDEEKAPTPSPVEERSQPVLAASQAELATISPVPVRTELVSPVTDDAPLTPPPVAERWQPVLVAPEGERVAPTPVVEERTGLARPALDAEETPPSLERVRHAEVASALELALTESASPARPGEREDEFAFEKAAPLHAAPEHAPPAEFVPRKKHKRPQPAAPAAEVAPAPKGSASRPRMHSTDLFESGISAEFFRNDEDSVPPSVDHLDEGEDGELPARAPLSPAALERRARLRRLVAGVVTFAAVLSIGVLGKQFVAPKPSIAAPAPARQEIAEEAPRAAPPEPPKPAAVKIDPPKQEEAPAAQAKPDDVKPADAKDAGAAETKPDPATAAELKKKAESLLNRGKRKEAIEMSRQAIEADPSDATPYLLLGSALQDSGRWKEGIEAYSECVRHATRGPINECRAVGGHK